jgi:hypothetical protein
MKHKTHTKKYTSARKLARGGSFGRHILTSCHQMSLRDVYFSRYVDVWDVLVTRIQPTCRIADTTENSERDFKKKKCNSSPVHKCSSESRTQLLISATANTIGYGCRRVCTRS